MTGGLTGGPRYVVIGAGLAGFRAAERLCELGHGGRVTVVGAESHRPYNRPPLSKQVLAGTLQPKDLRLNAMAELDVVWRLGTRAISLDPERRVVRLPGREELPYDGLVIATGMETRHLPGTPIHARSVWGLRTLEDVTGLQQALVRAKRVAIIGGGFIGCEAAASLRVRAIVPTIIDLAPTLLHRILGSTLGQAITNIHRDAGVETRLGVSVAGWEPQRRGGWRLALSDDSTVDADAVLVGIGTTATVDWLEGLGLDLSDGVVCDATCHVVGLDDVVACGDIARWPNDRFGTAPRRVEHWINAVEQARHAVDSLLVGRDRAAPFRPIPRFWSEQHGVRIQAVGVPTLGPEIAIVEGLLDTSRRAIVTFSDNGRLMGAVAINDPVELIEYARILEAQPPIVQPRLAVVGRSVGGERARLQAS